MNDETTETTETADTAEMLSAKIYDLCVAYVDATVAFREESVVVKIHEAAMQAHGQAADRAREAIKPLFKRRKATGLGAHALIVTHPTDGPYVITEGSVLPWIGKADAVERGVQEP